MAKLTDTTVRTAKPADKPYKLFDGGGLFLLVTPAGGKLWRLKYRHGGKEKGLAFGAYPAVSLKDARAKAAEARRLLAQDTAARRLGLTDSSDNPKTCGDGGVCRDNRINTSISAVPTTKIESGGRWGQRLSHHRQGRVPRRRRR